MREKPSGLLKVALVQMGAGAHKQTNLSMALGLSQEALEKGAQFILLPEVFNFRGDLRNTEVLAGAAEKIPGPTSNAFISLAKKFKASILLGSIIEKGSPERSYNTSVFIDPRGEIRAKYRKIHLFDATIGDKIVKESDYFRPGRRPATVNVEKFRMGMSICYDLRFPELYRHYAHKSVEILAVPSCFTRKTGEAHWEVLLRARAIENLSYVLAPNQVGMDARGIRSYGNSMIISPWGKVIARGSSEGQEIVWGQINFEEVSKARQVLTGIIK